MNSEEIKNYIKQQLEAGTNRETIEKSLQDAGWTLEDIQNALGSFDSPEKLAESVQEQVGENKIGEQGETETREVESFGSFLKLCWSKERSRELIVLGVILCFITFLYFVGPFIIIVGAWWGIREKRKNNFLKSLLINTVPIFLFFLFFVLYYFSSFLLGYSLFTAVILPPILSLMVVYLYTKRGKLKKYFKYFKRLKAGEINNFGSLFAEALLKSFVVVIVMLFISIFLHRKFPMPVSHLDRSGFYYLLEFLPRLILSLVGLVTILSGILSIVGLVKYLTSGETNPQKRSEAKKIIFYTGIVICLAIPFWLIIRFFEFICFFLGYLFI